MRLGIRASVLAVLLSAPAATAAAEPFLVLTAGKASMLERRLQQAARQGYRLLDSAEGVGLDGKPRMVALLRHAPDGPRQDYVAPSLPGDGDGLGQDGENRVNRRASEGYRLTPHGVLVRRVEDFWLPDSSYEGQISFVMGREEGDSERYHYATLVFTGQDRLLERLAQRSDEGYVPMALINSSRRLRIVLERALDGPAVRGDAASHDGTLYELLIGAKNKGTKIRLNRAARRGYRIRDAADPSINAPPMFLLERIAEPDPHFEYDFMRKPERKIRRDRLEAKLNKKARKGFRVAPAGITPRLVTLERDSLSGSQYRYRLLSSVDPPGLPRALEQAESRGLRFIAMFLAPGEVVVLLEGSESSPP